MASPRPLQNGGDEVREVRGMLAPFVLRRLKSSVLKQLVAKTEALEKVSLSEVIYLLRVPDCIQRVSRGC